MSSNDMTSEDMTSDGKTSDEMTSDDMTSDDMTSDDMTWNQIEFAQKFRFGLNALTFNIWILFDQIIQHDVLNLVLYI